jgi:acyl-CoA reductase-like NAD-dependent aldehyde dehydrogenase
VRLRSRLHASSHIHYEPKGVVLIIAPWNFPINLTFGPLVTAIAAGNCVIVKPSEHTPHASAVTKSIIEEVFDESEVAVVEGGIETSTSLLALPFNHIFFTGAPAIGKVVMEAASKHLTSVTLELGGKSPTIVDEPIELINSKEKPLALYIYSKSQPNIDRIMENTRAGGTCINHSMVHFNNNNLPFGGSNNSGIGKGHGFFGFEVFSNARGVFKQLLPFSAIELMTAPFNKLKQTLIDLSIKYF